ncbi:Eco57I restriction-modification methylase domain-containing protein [Flavobacterium sp. 270]|uniref:Eco57I restriction-modification methylase domain-containing protein n=1 Tax=Flavobacterium sp. 270 TaxID=2512114 RepID=UPI001064A576|nr:Eco57I restriction-modification methylase domain-containing protein [Flavobacterium sp. 270]
MLGKVFENMLEVTERKSKGAFYTPREIVHFMCQESLINYLHNAFNDHRDYTSDKKNIIITKSDIEDYIHHGHFAIENNFFLNNDNETINNQYQLPESIRNNAEVIDKKLSNILICDPAIGSGAFPVGLLHELVNAQLVLKPYFGLKYLKEKFHQFGFDENENINESRYVYRLKRHIIQESIYGVDIDASAIDIARLRLWLSLVVDEDDLEPIETLPNLDYKIVCGNSLIGMPEEIFWNLQVLEEIETLKPLFYDETDEKKKKELRKKISSKIKELLDEAENFSGYKIDFDFKLHFSEVWHKKGGFDIVIGNPPYGLLNKKQNQNFAITVNSEHLDYFKTSKKFESAKGGIINVFRLFITQSGILLNDNGIFAEIFPLAYTGDVTSKNIREHNLKNFSIIGIEAFPERDNESKRVFKHAKMSVAILFFTNKNKPTDEFYLRIHSDKYIDYSNDKVLLTKSDITKLDPNYFTIPVLSKSDLQILRKVYFNQKRISEVTNCYTGEIDLSLDKKYLQESSKFSTLLKGAIIGRYEIRLKMSQGEIMYLDSEEYLQNNKGSRSTHYKFDRIGMQGITGVNEKMRLKMTLIPKGVFLANSVNYILMPEGLYQNKLALLQLNSELHNYIFKLTSTNSNVNGYEVNNLPIIINSVHKDIVNIVVDYMLFITKINTNQNNILQYKFFDSLASAITYELYFPEEFKKANKEILINLINLSPIYDIMTDEEKLAVIQSEFERLYDDRHPVKFAIETLDSIEEIRIIKETLK